MLGQPILKTEESHEARVLASNAGKSWKMDSALGVPEEDRVFLAQRALLQISKAQDHRVTDPCKLKPLNVWQLITVLRGAR